MKPADASVGSKQVKMREGSRHKPTMRHRRVVGNFQTWISLSSALVAIFALGYSIYQGFEQRQFRKISGQPQMSISFYYNKEGAGFTLGNNGIGYANLKTFEVLVDGEPRSSWDDMCRALGFAVRPSYEFLIPRPETLITPGPSAKVFWIESGPQSKELVSKADRISIRLCHCSILNDCWKVDNYDNSQRVDVCPKQEIDFTASRP
jgi:hypothetical protein